MATKKWILTPDRYLKETEARLLMTFMEEKSIVALAKNKKKKKPVQDWAIIDIALSSGLRASEICNLRIKDLHIGRGESAIFVFKGKGNKNRLVTISDKLKKHLKAFIPWKKDIRESVHPDAYLFTTERRSKMSLSAIQRRFKKCSKAAGLNSRYSIHSCRHTYGTLLYHLTKDLRLVQKQLGHSSSRTTEVYADVLAEDAEKAVNQLYA